MELTQFPPISAHLPRGNQSLQLDGRCARDLFWPPLIQATAFLNPISKLHPLRSSICHVQSPSQSLPTQSPHQRLLPPRSKDPLPHCHPSLQNLLHHHYPRKLHCDQSIGRNHISEKIQPSQTTLSFISPITNSIIHPRPHNAILPLQIHRPRAPPVLSPFHRNLQG